MRSPQVGHGARLRWAGILCAWALCAAGGCATESTSPAPSATPTGTVPASPGPSPTPTPDGREDVKQVRYLYTLIALGTEEGVHETAEQSWAAAQDAVGALEQSLRGGHELSIDDAGVVRLPLSTEELGTFRDSIADQERQDGARGLELYMEKLGLAMDEIGPEVLEGYDGVVATVLLDMPDAELWLSGHGGTGGIFLGETSYARGNKSVDVMTENVTDVDLATTPVSTRVFAHEIGHSFGLGHADTAGCHDETAEPWDGVLPVRMSERECVIEEYGDSTNIMGGVLLPGAARDGELLNALQLRQMSALRGTETVDVTPGTAAASARLQVDLHTVSGSEEGVRLIAMPVVPDAVTPASEVGDGYEPAESRPYLVYSPEYGESLGADGPPLFTNNSLKVIYATTNPDGSIVPGTGIRAVTLSRQSDDSIFPEDIGAPPGQAGAVFVDAAGNTVSIISQQASSVTVRISRAASGLPD